MTGRVGIVAGAGELPRRLVESCRASGRDVFVLALEGAAEAETVRDVPHAWCRIGAAANGLALLREEGFRVIGPDQLLVGALAAKGPLGSICPDEQSNADIERGLRIARALGALDVGQAVIVQQGLVLGVEAIEGTDELIRRCALLRREGTGGVLVKVEKPGQERRADRPTIGPRTVLLAAETGLRGIAIEANGTIVLDRHEVVRAADGAGLFVIGVSRS